MRFKKQNNNWYKNFWLSDLEYYSIGLADEISDQIRIQIMFRTINGEESWHVIREYICSNKKTAFKQLNKIFLLLKDIKEGDPFNPISDEMVSWQKVGHILDPESQDQNNYKIIINS